MPVNKYFPIVCLTVLASVGDIYASENFKTNNSYNYFLGKESSSPPSPGYVEIAANLLQKFKSSKVDVDALKKFNTGLEQYFSFKLYERDDTNSLSDFLKISLTESFNPVIIKKKYVFDVSADKNETISFEDIKIYGFPAIKTNARPEYTYDALGSATEYKFFSTYKSDVIIITGSFVLHNSTYFFVHNLKQNIYSGYIHRARGLKYDQDYIEHSLKFSNEEILHTYDSSYENYAQINEVVIKCCTELLLKTYFREILPESFHFDQVLNYLESDLKFVSSYKKRILSALIESAIQYIRSKGLNSFEVKPINFNTSTRARAFVLSYKDIKLDGLLNYVHHELVNSTSDKSDISNNLRDALQLTYPDEGEKQTFISFAINDGFRENLKKFRVKTITIVAAYNSTALKRPYKVSRNKEAFLNGSGFSIKFDLDKFDPTYEFVVTHIGEDISRAIEETLLTEAL